MLSGCKINCGCTYYSHMNNHSLFYNHLTLPIFGRNKTGHFDNRWEMLYYVVGGSFSLWALGNVYIHVVIPGYSGGWGDIGQGTLFFVLQTHVHSTVYTVLILALVYAWAYAHVNFSLSRLEPATVQHIIRSYISHFSSPHSTLLLP